MSKKTHTKELSNKQPLNIGGVSSSFTLAAIPLTIHIALRSILITIAIIMFTTVVH